MHLEPFQKVFFVLYHEFSLKKFGQLKRLSIFDIVKLHRLKF